MGTFQEDSTVSLIRIVGTGNEYRIETHVYDATCNLVSLVTDFLEMWILLDSGISLKSSGANAIMLCML